MVVQKVDSRFLLVSLDKTQTPRSSTVIYVQLSNKKFPKRIRKLFMGFRGFQEVLPYPVHLPFMGWLFDSWLLWSYVNLSLGKSV